MSGIELECNAAIATIWINRPEKRNALTLAMLDELRSIIEQVEADPALRCMVIRGRSGTFCTGIDLAVLAGEARDISAAARKAAEVYNRIHSSPVPSICAIEGFCTGAGFELMLSADIAIASSDSRIGEISMRLGMFAGAGPTYHLPRIIGIRRSKELILSGKMISGVRAAAWGLVNESVDSEAFDQAVTNAATQFTDKPPYQLGLTKSVINAGLDADRHSLMLVERLAFDLTASGADAAEGVSALLEKRKPVWGKRQA